MSKSYIKVVGKMWMPPIFGASIIELTPYDVENIFSYQKSEPCSLQGAVEHWVNINAGNFAVVVDFCAVLTNPLTDKEVLFDWSSPDSEPVYNRAMFDD